MSQTFKPFKDMEAKINFRSRVMKYAWQIWRAARSPWRLCMLKAWQVYKLTRKMRTGIVSFSYLKADGSLRHAHGTLVNIPDGATLRGKRITKPAYRTVAYFDTDRGAFRCFRIENLAGVPIC